MKYIAKLSKAKAKLLVEYPAFGQVVARMEFRQNDDIQNCICDGRRFEYNDDFIASCSGEDLLFALSHAALHSILHHITRKQKRASYLWQLATDYAVSSMLEESGFGIPPFARYQKRFRGMYAEEIYEILKDEIKNEEFSDDEELESGYNEQNKRQQRQNNQKPNNQASDEKLQMEVELEERLAQKFIEQLLEKFAKELPEPIQRHFKVEPKTKIDWRSELRHTIENYAKEDYTLFPPSTKLLSQEIYLPALKSEKLQLSIAIDTSGSIDEALLEEFLSEVASILLLIPNYTIDLIAADDKVREHITLQPGEELPTSFTGGCGTDFRVLFDYMEQTGLAPKLLLYFSDLEGFFPKNEPLYEVAWITKSEKKPPFGRKILLPFDGATTTF